MKLCTCLLVMVTLCPAAMSPAAMCPTAMASDAGSTKSKWHGHIAADSASLTPAPESKTSTVQLVAGWQDNLQTANRNRGIYYSYCGAQPQQYNAAMEHYAKALKLAEQLGAEHPTVAITQLSWAAALIEPLAGEHAKKAMDILLKCEKDKQWSGKFAKQLDEAKCHYGQVLDAHHRQDEPTFRSLTTVPSAYRIYPN